MDHAAARRAATATLAAHLAGHLRTALPGYEVVDDLDAIPPELRGVHRANPVNRAALGGVQLELPPRGAELDAVLVRPPPATQIPHLAPLVDGLVAAAAQLA